MEEHASLTLTDMHVFAQIFTLEEIVNSMWIYVKTIHVSMEELVQLVLLANKFADVYLVIREFFAIKQSRSIIVLAKTEADAI